MKENDHDVLEVKYIDQKNEGLEAWVRKGQSNWVRLDFILEYYLSGDVNLSKQFRGQLGEASIAKQYYNLLYAKFSKETSDGRNFDFEKYLSWQKSNPTEINNAIKLLNAENQ